VPRLHRNIAIVGSVVLFHVAALWALQAGLLRRAVEIVIPVQILSELITPPAPKVEPPPTPPPPPKAREPVRQPPARKIERELPPPPKPVAIPESRPALNAPTGVLQAQPPPAPITAPVAAEARPTTPAPSPTEVELPSSDASYLQNPAPVYPPISKRLGEQGKVIVRVLIGADGAPQKAELKRSSGFERLDQSALEYVMKCRYVPGKVGGVPQAMWHEAPVTFVLQ
jgi:periplasmic protein TonB